MLKQRILNDLKKAIEELGYTTTDIDLYIPKNYQFGDYTTNIALQLSKQKSEDSNQSPTDIAKKIMARFKNLEFSKDCVEKIEIAGGGFINFFLKDDALMENVPKVCNYSLLVSPKLNLEAQKQKVLVEFGHPNTHKEYHIGHMKNIILGESISRILSAVGNQVVRANYQGDIGLHVAKALWGIGFLGLEVKESDPPEKKAHFLGKAYATGSKAYEEDEVAQLEIKKINTHLYEKNPKVFRLWEKTRRWSLEYYDEIYQKLGVKFDRLYFESEVEQLGKKIVLEHIDDVFKEDQGAIIFPGEEYGLHNRVFVSSAGHATYEGKEVGLAKLEYDEHKFDKAIHVVANEQEGYFKVAFLAIAFVFPELKGKKHHLSYGLLDLKTGKMSSRTGEVITFHEFYRQVRKKVEEIMKDSKFGDKDSVVDIVSIGAIKFALLKYSPETNIVFDLEKSVALEGDSGPYIQYTYARSKSVLRNAQYSYIPGAQAKELEKEERELLRDIEHFENYVIEAARELSPNAIAGFLLEVSKNFNLFYQKHPIIKAETQKAEFRLALTCAVAVMLKQGLDLLGIEAPEQM